MNLTLFMQVLPKAGLGWLGVFATICKINPAPGPKMQDFTCGFSEKTV